MNPYPRDRHYPTTTLRAFEPMLGSRLFGPVVIHANGADEAKLDDWIRTSVLTRVCNLVDGHHVSEHLMVEIR